MGVIFRFLVRTGILLVVFVFLGCGKPQLKSDRKSEPDLDEKEMVDEPADDVQSIRERVIGRSFVNLTLGSKQFENALVQDITDKEIVVKHAGGVEKVPWSDVPDEVREQWGYRSGSELLVEKVIGLLPSKEPMPTGEIEAATAASEVGSAGEEKTDRRTLAKEIARQQQMIEAQLVGIRNIEADLDRHSRQLNELKKQLYSIKARQSPRRSGGIVIEQVEGRSTLVDRKAEARAVESKVKQQEALIAQFLKSLEAANSKYESMRIALGQLRSR